MMWMNMKRRHANQPTGVTQTSHGEWKHPTQFAALCPDGVVRRTARIGHSPDTAFSWSAVMRIKMATVYGYITTEEINGKMEHVFRPLIPAIQSNDAGRHLVEYWAQNGWLTTRRAKECPD